MSYRPAIARTSRLLAVALAAGALLVLAALVVLTAGRRYLPFDAYAVLSDSMAPAIPSGSVVVLRPVPAAALQVGDVITFRRTDGSGETLTHRIVEIAEPGEAPVVVTKGDANPAPDADVVRLQGTGLRAVFAVPLLGFALNRMSTPVARLALLSLPLVIGLMFWRRSNRAARTASPVAAEASPLPAQAQRWQVVDLQPLAAKALAARQRRASSRRRGRDHGRDPKRTRQRRGRQ